MKVNELKNKILKGDVKSILNKPIILLYKDNDFIATSYAREIAKRSNLEIQITSDYVVPEPDIFGMPPSILYNIREEEIKDLPEYFMNCENNIVICKKCSKEIKDTYNDLIVEIPALEDWQIQDFIHKRVNLPKEVVEWLCNVSNNNIYRIDSEISKIELFKENHLDVFNAMNEDNAFCDINNYTLFTFTNAMLKKDKNSIEEMLKAIEYFELEPATVLSVLHKNMRNILLIQSSANITATDLGLTPNQFKALNYSKGKYSISQLMRNLKLISEIDLMLKNGVIPYSVVIDYLVIKILTQ